MSLLKGWFKWAFKGLLLAVLLWVAGICTLPFQFLLLGLGKLDWKGAGGIMVFAYGICGVILTLLALAVFARVFTRIYPEFFPPAGQPAPQGTSPEKPEDQNAPASGDDSD